MVRGPLPWSAGYFEKITFYKDYISEDAFPDHRRHALKMWALLGSTYLCEQFFCRMKHVKSKTRSQITDQRLENTLRIATSNVDANIDKLVRKSIAKFPIEIVKN
jgi:hypothetical protein